MRINCKQLYYISCITVCICVFFSCSVEKGTAVKNFPADTAFVFSNKIILKGNLTKDEKNKLAANLVSYWDDSLYAPSTRQYGFSFHTSQQPFFHIYSLKNPPVYDSANRVRTIGFMTGYLKSQGYYYSLIKDSAVKSYYKGQRRITMVDTIYTGKQTIIDSEKYAIDSSRLQFLADSSKKESLIQPGKSPFAKGLIGGELDRLVALYRQKGFFLINRDNLIAEADTLDQSLLNFSADPFEQAQNLAEAVERRKQNPTAVITIMKRENTDTSFQLLPDSAYFKEYRIGNIYYYPEADVRLLADSVLKDTGNISIDRYNEYTMYYRKKLFWMKPLRNMTLMHKGRLYNDDLFNRTINNFNQVPAWSQVDYRTVLRQDSVDFYFLLSPARPQNMSFSVEGSRNTGDFLSTGTLIGTALNTTYTNRNFVFKNAVQFLANFSNGVEFSLDKNYPFLQTFSSSLGFSLNFPNVTIPKWIPNFNTPKALRKNMNRRGLAKIDISANYSERNNFFRVRSLVAGFGWEWKRRTNVYQFKLVNVELYSLDTLPLLISAFKENPFLRSSFNTGSVVSMQFGWSNTFNDKRHANRTNLLRAAGEFSPNPFVFAVPGLKASNIYNYFKVELEARRQWKRRKSTIATRLIGGVGYNFGSNPKFGNTLPFFKQFIGGGPNSMRAWGLRQLGLGSSIVSDTSTFRERYGDMQLELNGEYRFNVATIGSVNIGSALFADIGNIWNIKKNPALPDAEFSLSRFDKDIAVGIGTGLRLDFNYFLIRLDFGLKLKDPARQENGGWLDFNDFTWQNKEYSIKDASGNYSPLPRNNFAIQLGIGLPF